jgi:hypothetical protein
MTHLNLFENMSKSKHQHPLIIRGVLSIKNACIDEGKTGLIKSADLIEGGQNTLMPHNGILRVHQGQKLYNTLVPGNLMLSEGWFKID